MRAAALVTLVARDARRAGGALSTSAFGIAAGVGALVFFSALGLAVKATLLGEVFPIDRIELEPAAGPEPSLLVALVGGGKPPPGIRQDAVDRLASVHGVEGVYPKLRFAFPSGAFGGKELIGREIGTHEMLADGVDPRLLAGQLSGKHPFRDPLEHPGPPCKGDDDCSGGQYCERPSEAPSGVCSEPIPVLASPYVVELFNKGIAQAHGLPQIGKTLLDQAQGVTFRLQLGVSMMGKARRGAPRDARARLVGVSTSAIDIGATLPLEVVKRLNREFYGPEAADRYSSVLVKVKQTDAIADVVTVAAQEGLVPRDSKARDVSVLINGVMGLLTLVSGAMLLVASTNIAYTFRVIVAERRAEIGLYRALGASRRDISLWLVSLSSLVGVLGGAAGVALARVAAIAADVLAATKLPDFPFKPASFFAFPPWLVGLAIVSGGLFAVLGALSAVRAASRIDPSAALSER